MGKEYDINKTKFHSGDKVVPVNHTWWYVGIIESACQIKHNFRVEPVCYSIGVGIVGKVSAVADEIRLATDDEWEKLKHKHFPPEMLEEIEGDSNG